MLHPRAVRRHPAGPGDFAAALTGRTIDGARRRGKYLWLPGRRRRPARPPRHERPAAGRRRRTRRCRRTSGSGSPSPTAAPTCASSTSARSATCSFSRGGAELPPVIAHIAPDPLEHAFDLAPARRPAAHAADRHQAGPARPVAGQRRRQHLRRRGALAGQAALGAGHGPAARGRGAPAARRRQEVFAEALTAAAPPSTASTSTSTARAATSTARWTSTAGPASRARAAVRRSAVTRS